MHDLRQPMRRTLLGRGSAGFVVAALALSAALGARSQPSRLVTPDVRRAMEQVRPEALREHVRFLADDALEGRDTASPGGEKAARYIADHFERLRLRPMGDDRSFFQRVPFLRIQRNLAASRFVLPGEPPIELEGGRDFLPSPRVMEPVQIEAPLVFAGYGISAPEYQYDDYQGLKVAGSLVLVRSGEPRSDDPQFFAGERETRHASLAAKAELARRLGAVGLLVLPSGPFDAAAWERTGRALAAPRIALPDSAPRELPVLTLQPEAGARLLETGRRALPEGAPADRPFRFPSTEARPARLVLAVEREAAPASNVLGLLEGRDPALKRQVVVYTAHYDHVGRGTGTGDTIYNGAWDNASGTASVLEIARAFAALKERPRRSILFLLVTGEEKGLLGSRYYVRRPAVPIEATAANINLDMTEIFGIPKEIVPQGAERSTLLRSAEAVAQELGLKIGQDPTPELRVYTRSDQFSFAQAGVPAVFMRWASDYRDVDAATARARAQEKLQRIYHQVTDEFDPTWSWEGMREQALHAFLLGLHVANEPEMPRWNPGDEFDRPRGAPGESAGRR